MHLDLPYLLDCDRVRLRRLWRLRGAHMAASKLRNEHGEVRSPYADHLPMVLHSCLPLRVLLEHLRPLHAGRKELYLLRHQHAGHL